MIRFSISIAVASIVAVAPAGSRASDRDYYLSVPNQSAILRLDADTLAATPFVTGLLVPFYGFWRADGRMFMPDKEWGAIFEIDAQGNVSILTAGGLLARPFTTTPHPNGTGLIASDLFAGRVVFVDWNGNQTLVHDRSTSGGLITDPGGIAFDSDGNLYVANNVGNTIIKVDPQNNATLFSNDPLLFWPGGIAIDNSGNMFVCQYGGNNVVRFRLDTGEAEVFAGDPLVTLKPNDLKLARSGGLLLTSKASNVVRIDALGTMTEIYKNPTYGEIVGICVREDATLCSGSFTKYGAGTAGSGGIVPRLGAIFSPCPGHDIALEFEDFLGGALCTLLVGLKDASLPFLGGTLLIDPSLPFLLISFPLPGAGPGAGELRIPFTVKDNPALVGVSVYLQAAGNDAAAPAGVSLSNGLHEVIGN